MRKLSIFLVILFLFSMLSGCGSEADNGVNDTQPTDMSFSTISEFLDAYKRVSVSDLENNFNRFVSDLNKAVHLISVDDLSSNGWEKTFELDMGEYVFEMYSLDTVLFGKTATISSIVNRDESSIVHASLDVVIDTGKEVDSIALATSVCDKMFNKYGDAFYIYVSGEESSEHDLRQAYETGVDFNCMWVIQDDSGNIGFSIGISEGGLLISCSFE